MRGSGGDQRTLLVLAPAVTAPTGGGREKGGVIAKGRGGRKGARALVTTCSKRAPSANDKGRGVLLYKQAPCSMKGAELRRALRSQTARQRLLLLACQLMIHHDQDTVCHDYGALINAPELQCHQLFRDRDGSFVRSRQMLLGRHLKVQRAARHGGRAGQAGARYGGGGEGLQRRHA